MATPRSTASDDGSGPKKYEQVTFRFCSECSNMLYPKEDEDSHKLQYTCRTCQYTEEAQSSCVFRNILNNTSGETAGVTQDVGSDPTVSENSPPPVMCLCCGNPIICITCGSFSDQLAVPDNFEPEIEWNDADDDSHMSGWHLPVSCFETNDPFAEYDEELMDDASENSDHTDHTQWAFCGNDHSSDRTMKTLEAH